MNSRSVPTIMLAIVAIGIPLVDAAGLMHFSVTQVRQLDVGAPVVRAYLDLTDSAGQPLAALPESSLEATLGEWSTQTVSVAPFSGAEQGVAYVFLVDISKSLSPELFERMVGGIEAWVDGLDTLDRAALIAFGESSQLIVDFTGNKEAILTGLASLGPTDNETLLHQALVDGLEISRRLDPDLPGRRALVIFSDGKDEGSGFAADDILAKLRDDPSPIYAIGYSRLRDPAEHQSYLDLLQRFATNSGGRFFAAEQTRFSEAYDAIRATIQRVWMADFLCADCRADGSLHRLQVQVTLDGQVLSSGGMVRLLPLATADTPEPVEPITEEPAPVAVEPSIPVDESAVPSESTTDPAIDWRPSLIGLAVLAAVLVLWGIRSRNQRQKPHQAPAGAEPHPPYPPLEPRSDPPMFDLPDPIHERRDRSVRRRPRAPRPEAPRPDVPPAPQRTRPIREAAKQVRLIVVQGSRKGRQYSFVVDDRAVVGRRSSCDCVLAEETGIDAIQFELLHEDDGLYIENLSDRLPTLVTGQPLTEKLLLTSDTIIGTGETVLRIVFH